MKHLVTKTLYDKKAFIYGWSAGISLMIIAVLSFFPAFSKDKTFESIADQIPPAFAGFIGDVTSFTTITGYIATQLYDIRIPLFLMILGLILAQSLTVAEEEKGTLRTLLATPLGRVRALLEKWLAALAIITIIASATVLASYAGVYLIHADPPHQLIFQLALMTVLFGITVVSVPFGIGLATGSRAFTMAVGILLTIGSFILSSFATAVDWLKPWEVISLMYYYDAASLPEDGINTLHLLILASIIIVSLLIGIIGFRRRDVSGN